MNYYKKYYKCKCDFKFLNTNSKQSSELSDPPGQTVESAITLF